MSELIHRKPGIYINTGDEVGESFFIDHRTRVIIKNKVNIYQGVTVGVLNVKKELINRPDTGQVAPIPLHDYSGKKRSIQQQYRDKNSPNDIFVTFIKKSHAKMIRRSINVLNSGMLLTSVSLFAAK